MTLDELGQKHGTDKASHAHNYLEAYDALLTPYRDRSPLTLIEIGVRDGASVRMWQDYFPGAQIVGVDIVEGCREHAGPRITIEIGDGSDAGFLDDLATKYPPDIVFDDGSHLWSDQIDTFRRLFPCLSAGGIFICEDLHTSRSKWVEKYGRAYTDAAAAYFGRVAAEVAAEGHVYGTMLDPEVKDIQRQVEWVRFGRGFVAIKKK